MTLGLLKKLGWTVVLLLVAYAGFRWGPIVFPRLERALGMSRPEASAEPVKEEPSAELADRTLDRFERFRKGEGSERLALGGIELTSVMRYALPGIVPPGVDRPTVTLSDGRVGLRARVARAAFPRLPRLDDVLGILPDTVEVQIEGSLVPLDREHLALLVDHIEAARIPLPRRMIPQVLAGFGRDGSSALPEDALAVPLPDGLHSVYVQRDSLVLIAER
jgi:hypothetical protein